MGSLTFRSSPSLTLGVEIELQILVSGCIRAPPPAISQSTSLQRTCGSKTRRRDHNLNKEFPMLPSKRFFGWSLVAMVLLCAFGLGPAFGNGPASGKTIRPEIVAAVSNPTACPPAFAIPEG